MNEKLIRNIIAYQDKIDELNPQLLDGFITDLVHYYNFLTKEKDIFINNKETLIKIRDSAQHSSTYHTINVINKLSITRDTKFEVFKYVVENNRNQQDMAICMFSVYFFCAQSIKLLKRQQKEIVNLFKVNRGRDYLKDGVIVVDFLMATDLIKEKNFRESIDGFNFEFLHELNQKEHIKFNELSPEEFIKYISVQFSTYKLYRPMTLQKNSISLKQAIKPFFDSNIDQYKKDLLSTFLNMIRETLDLDNENKQFLDNLVLNTKLNDLKLTQPKIADKIKRPKI